MKVRSAWLGLWDDLDLPCTPQPLQGCSCILLLPLPDEPLAGVWEEDEDEEEVNKTVESEADGEEGDGHQGRDGRVAEQAVVVAPRPRPKHWPIRNATRSKYEGAK